MAPTITSFTPTTGPTTGGTNVVITGTGLDLVTNVQFGTIPGTINTKVTNTATTLNVIAPGGATAGSVKIALEDNVNGTYVESTTTYTYTAVTLPTLTSVPANKWKVQVDASPALDGSQFTDIRGLLDFAPTVATTTQSDGDYDSGVWGSEAKTELKWQCVLKISRKRAANYVEDPGQAILRAAHDQVGAAGSVLVRWYDRNGHGSEAYQGLALVEWTEDGGDKTVLSTSTVTLMGQGVRTPITNPVS